MNIYIIYTFSFISSFAHLRSPSNTTSFLGRDACRYRQKHSSDDANRPGTVPPILHNGRRV